MIDPETKVVLDKLIDDYTGNLDTKLASKIESASNAGLEPTELLSAISSVFFGNLPKVHGALYQASKSIEPTQKHLLGRWSITDPELSFKPPSHTYLTGGVVRDILKQKYIEFEELPISSNKPLSDQASLRGHETLTKVDDTKLLISISIVETNPNTFEELIEVIFYD